MGSVVNSRWALVALIAGLISGGWALHRVLGRDGRPERAATSATAWTVEPGARWSESAETISPASGDADAGNARVEVETAPGRNRHPPSPARPARAARAASEQEDASTAWVLASANPGLDEARLRIQVVSLETGQPLGSVPLHQRPTAWLPLEGGSYTHPIHAPGRRSDGPVTDDDGAVECVVPARTPHVLMANWSEHPSAAPREIEVSALAPGETCSIVVELSTALDLAWFGRIVDGESEAPLGGAKVDVVEDDLFGDPALLRSAVARGDGSVELEFASWKTSYARVAWDDYAPAYVRLERGHAAPARAASVRLLRAAALVVRVIDASGAPLAGVRVRAYADGQDLVAGGEGLDIPWNPVWRARTEADGRCELPGLPPRVSLSFELISRGERLRLLEDALVLQPGQRSETTWTIGTGRTIEGTAVDPEGKPRSR